MGSPRLSPCRAFQPAGGRIRAVLGDSGRHSLQRIRDNAWEMEGLIESLLKLPLEEFKQKVLERIEKDSLGEILARDQGNMKPSSEHAGLRARSLYAKMRRYEFKKEDFKHR